MDLQFFDRAQEVHVLERRLPHWSQAGAVCFMTYRTADSLPKPVVARCIAERDELLKKHGIPPGDDWSLHLDRLPPEVRGPIRWGVSKLWDLSLDQCHGQCVLKRPELSKIVADNLLHLDGKDDYDLTDFVVMPNHVHVLAAFKTESAMLARATAWRRYQARQINKALGISGHFWQDDVFDHLVRSLEQFEYYRRYIADNPVQARLKPGEFVHYSKKL